MYSMRAHSLQNTCPWFQAGWKAWVPTHLLGVGCPQVEAGGGDGQRDAHPCELEVALPQDAGQHFARML